ncbi:FAD-dependent oxidoreductase [Ascidiaceihabitans sp.]|uniref:NAD(P)/FAD-dependent oxidoreductase n=1 Tax=Ascidiaceihabitans sp. TaxID=1872644 RepID=UPI003296D7DE
MHVVIIGAGIIGASLAYSVAQAGGRVTVVDASGPAAAASGQSFGWINASFFHDTDHFRLRAAGIDAYRKLCSDLALPVTFSGCLCWEDQGAALDAQAQALVGLGYEADILSSKQIAAMEPHIKVPERALFFQAEAAADTTAMTHTLLKASGARRVMGCAVDAVEISQGRATGVRIAGGVLKADKVVVAAGTASPDLLSPLGVNLPMLRRPGVIFHTRPLPRVVSHVCVAPIGEFRQCPDGRIVMPAAVAHQADQSSAIEATPYDLATQACARLQKILPDVALEWEEANLAMRPVPQDGLPVVGACGADGVFTSVMHSGVTLAPIVAQILAQEILEQPLTNAQADLIAPYRPDRFQSA